VIPDRPVLPAREGYRLWARTYDAERNPVVALSEEAVSRLSPSVRGTRLLDAACGTGRHLAAALKDGAHRAVGVDLVPAMLSVAHRRPGAAPVVAADVRALPLRASSFDLVWCRLAAGHLPVLDPLYQAIARVLRPGGHLVVTDFHAAAQAAGHRRTFRDGEGNGWTIESHAHRALDHQTAAAGAGLELEDTVEGRVGPAVRACYRRAGLERQYRRDMGLPLIIGLRFRR
jgi:malonyl-CoA O-methyltransferase